MTANRVLGLGTSDGPFVEVSREPEGARIRFDWVPGQPWRELHLTRDEAQKIGRALLEAAKPEPAGSVFVMPCPASIWLLGQAAGCERGAGHDAAGPPSSPLHQVTLRWGTGNAYQG